MIEIALERLNVDTGGAVTNSEIEEIFDLVPVGTRVKIKP
jgi:hypothetical protein